MRTGWSEIYTAICDVTNLDGVFQRPAQQEEGGGRLELLASEESEGVLQRRLAPTLLGEVVAEKLHHLPILYRSGNRM